MPETRSTPPPSSPVVEVVPGGAVRGTIRPPGSKSLTNRALICAAFGDGPSKLTGALRSEDTLVMIEALSSVGIHIEVSDGGRTLEVKPRAKYENEPVPADAPIELYIANSGTSVRFLSAALSAAGGNYRLHGVERMHSRPIGDLVDALRPVQRGTIAAESENGCPPVLIRSEGWNDQASLSVAGSVSSQYLSGLMMASPIAGRATEIEVVGELVSRPYVEMTAEVMRSFGASPQVPDVDESETGAVCIKIGSQRYRGVDYEIEPDASAASYFWATAAITGGEVTVEGLNAEALQGDVGFCDVLEEMGCLVERASDSITVRGGPLRGVDVDMNAISDTVQTLSVVSLFADGPTRVRGVAHNRFKETDRIGDLACELRKLGAKIDEHDDGLTITPGLIECDPVGVVKQGITGATLETYHDHRMAMSFALAGLRVPGVRILDPACTMKTYPEFFADLENLTGRAHRWSGN